MAIQNSKTHISMQEREGIVWCAAQNMPYEVYARGFAFRSGELLRGAGLVSLLGEAAGNGVDSQCQQKLSEVLSELNGNFAIIIRTKKWLFAAVDRIRSIPLFYGIKDGHAFLSDDAYWVKGRSSKDKPDLLNVKEFMLTGYITGSDTFFPEVKQLQAGEFLWCQDTEDKPVISVCRYYRWLHGDYLEVGEKELFEKMGQMHNRVFERFSESTRGSPLVIPLSGGYDSRLLAVMLKRLGREDVTCFSYGRPGNWESALSRRVAKILGYKWNFVPYSFKKWRKWSEESRDIGEYQCYAANLSSIPVMTNLLAVKELKEQGAIAENSIFVPGHTGDFISGGHIPLYWAGKQSISFNELLAAIWRRHYSLWKTSISLHEDLVRKLSGQLEDVESDTYDGAISAFEYQEWQERQAKFIVNSVRVYEFYGFEWRLPFWDNDFMEFWQRVPVSYRIGKVLYDRFCVHLFRGEGLGLRSLLKNVCKIPYLRVFSNVYNYTALGIFNLKEFSLCTEFYEASFGKQGMRKFINFRDPFLVFAFNEAMKKEGL